MTDSCIPAQDTLSVCKHQVPTKFGCKECFIENGLSIFDWSIRTRVDEIDDKLKETIFSLNNRINALHKFKLNQIDDKKQTNKRIEELENAYKADFETAKEIIFAGAQTHASILRLEKGLKDLEQLFYDEKEKFRCNDKKPHECPVCNGEGRKILTVNSMHPLQSYTVDAGGVHSRCCEACKGKGIVWG